MEFKKFREKYTAEPDNNYLKELFVHIQSQFKELYDHINCTFNIDELKSRKKNSITQVFKRRGI